MDPQAIINTMEVLDTKPINELVSEVTIKVCYVSDEPNPNGTVITKEVGKEIAATLPGAPVAGFFNKETGDFEEHSRRITFANGELNIEDITKPYGFVGFDKPWYQDFDEEGTIRTYLMCKAYLWTRQYEEASLAFNKGQSMELDEKKMAGYYSGNVFVFTSATLDKLCILGDSYAPCFAGAKILANYAKQYESLAEKLEKTLGRRYYVMADKLIQKPEKITLEYAIQLGWNLTDAVYIQLANRGADGKYSIEGIFAEAGGQFVILQDRETLEYVKVDLVITDADTVELGSEMLAVSQTWTVKAPAEPTSPESLGTGTIATPDAPAVQAYAAKDGKDAKPEDAPAAQAAPAVQYVVITKYVNAPTVNPSAATEAAPVPNTGETVAASQVGQGPVGAESDSGTVSVAPSEFTEQLALKEAEVETLKEMLAEYKAKIDEVETAKKTELVTEYSKVLTKEEVESVTAKIAEYTSETLEAKFAVLFARKARTMPATSFQVNLDSLPADDTANLPEFMKQALEYDKEKQITLK